MEEYTSELIMYAIPENLIEYKINKGESVGVLHITHNATGTFVSEPINAAQSIVIERAMRKMKSLLKK